MFFNPRLLLFMTLFVLGLIWCYKVIQRLPDDIQEIREVHETGRTIGIIIVWIITLFIAIAIIFFALIRFLGRTISTIRGLL